MDKWKIGDKKTLIKQKIFDLNGERVQSRELNKKFHSKIIKFKIELDLIRKTDKNLKLNDINIDLLKKGLEKVFFEIKRSFKKRDGPYYIQMNLTFDGLKKQFLKSGIVDLFGNVDSKNIVFWVINQLDQVNQSSENLVFSNELYIDFIIVKTVKPRGKNDYCSNMYITSNYTKTMSNVVRKIKNNYFFINEIKKGLVDMSIYFDENVFENSYSCILISIYFGLIFQKHKNDMKKTLTFINYNFENLEDFQKSFIKQYNLNMIDYYTNQTSIKMYNYISKKIKRNILIFIKKSFNTIKLIYSTSFKNFSYIKLLINDNHCEFIFNSVNLERKNTTFCDFCKRSFFKINIHKCVREKCINCFLYKNRLIDEYYLKICKNDIIQNTFYKCIYCCKIIKNHDCKRRHQLLKLNYCKHKFFCDLCQTYYSKCLLHKCGEYFCKKCLKYHKKSMFCSTSVIPFKKKIKETIFIVDLKIYKDNYKVISLCEFINEEQLNIYNNFFIKTFI